MNLFVVLASSLLLLTDGSWGQSCNPGQLTQAFNNLFNFDQNNVYGMISINCDSQKLIKVSSPQALVGPTIQPFITLVQNYRDNPNGPVNVTLKNQFLDAIMRTPVMQNLAAHLQNTVPTLRKTLDRIWFTTYGRQKNSWSSGFKHVFVGEISRRRVSGLHSWITFYKDEHDGNLQYKEWLDGLSFYTELTTAAVVAVKYKWFHRTKPYGSMFVGTSPEFDMAAYTLCFFKCREQRCPVGDGYFTIQTYIRAIDGYEYVDSAFPMDLQ